MYDMGTVSTRELQHKVRNIGLALEKGTSFAWTQRGKVIGYIHPARKSSQKKVKWPNILERIRSYGGGAAKGKLISEQIYEDRGE